MVVCPRRLDEILQILHHYGDLLDADGCHARRSSALLRRQRRKRQQRPERHGDHQPSKSRTEDHEAAGRRDGAGRRTRARDRGSGRRTPYLRMVVRHPRLDEILQILHRHGDLLDADGCLARRSPALLYRQGRKRQQRPEQHSDHQPAPRHPHHVAAGRRDSTGRRARARDGGSGGRRPYLRMVVRPRRLNEIL